MRTLDHIKQRFIPLAQRQKKKKQAIKNSNTYEEIIFIKSNRYAF